MNHSTTGFLLACSCLVLSLAGCNSAPTPTPTAAVPTATSTTLPSATPLPALTATATLPPTATSVPTATRVPSPTPTVSPLLASRPVIDAANAAQLQQVAQWGLGAITVQTSLQGGKLVLATTSEGLYLYDAASLGRIQFFPQAKQPNFSDDGRWMVYSDSSQIGIYDLVNLRPFKSPPVSAAMTAAAFSQDNKMLAVVHSSTDIDVIRLEDMSVTGLTRERTAQYEPETRTIAFSPDNQFLLTQESGGLVMWNIKEKKLAWYLKNIPQFIPRSPFSPDGRYFFSQDKNFTYLREARFGGQVFSGLGGPTSASYSADGKMFFLLNKGVATIYTLGDYPGGVVRTLMVEGAGSVNFSADSTKFFAGNKVLNLADFKTEPVNSAPPKEASISPAQAVELGHFSNFKGVAAGKAGELWVWGATNRAVYLWEAGSGKVQTFEIKGNRFIANIAFNPATQRFAACTDQGLEVYSVKDQSHKLFTGCAPRGWVAFSPDGSKIARAAMTRVDLLNAADGSTLNSLIEHNIDVNKLAFSADGNWLAVGTIKNRENGYCQVSLWKLNPVGLVGGFRGKLIPGGGKDTGVYDLAVSPDGQWLLGLTNMLRQWRIADAEQMKYNEGSAEYLALSPDGGLAVSAGSGQVSFWSMPALERAASLAAGGQVLGMTFNASGTQFATITKEGVLRLWAVP